MLKIGVIGLGSMGKNHARVCSELSNVELVGVADIDKASAKTIATRFDTKAFYDYKDMITEVDCVVIATPTVTHHSIAMDFLTKGKHVLVEKPITENIAKAGELVKTSTKQGVVLAVGHIERHNPAVKFVKDSLAKGTFGELISLTSKRVSNFPGRIKDVGVIFDFGIHDVDIMHYLAGDVQSVYARAGTFNKNISNEDHAFIILNFTSGVCGVVEVNWLTPMKIRKLFLTGSEQFVEVDYIDQSVSMSASSFKRIDEMNLFNVPIQYNINHASLEKKEPLRNEITDFIQAIEHHQQPLVTGEDGLLALKIAEAASQSYKTGKEVKLL